ncbi:unnamed protein product [Caenorhabditis sp. 36 PRJEB53466]|nr:unnamed protein product [Caenorhabditis sp. 36 PRJEB53466]
MPKREFKFPDTLPTVSERLCTSHLPSHSKTEALSLNKMSYDRNGLFSSDPPPSMWSHNEFPPIGSVVPARKRKDNNENSNPTGLTDNGASIALLPQYQSEAYAMVMDPAQEVNIGALMPSVDVSQPPPTIMPLMVATSEPDIVKSIGQISWLSSKAALIADVNGGRRYPFQLKDFCDTAVQDLVYYIRVGFTFSFTACKHDDGYACRVVQPLTVMEAEEYFRGRGEIDLNGILPSPANSKDLYFCQLEEDAIPQLLNVFKRNGRSILQLNQLATLHSNQHSGTIPDEDVYRYIGSSSLKRRDFIERRTHLFHLYNDDSIELQHPALYTAVTMLCSYLLRRGGLTSIQALYEFYTSDEMPLEIREYNGESRNDFLNLITEHSWAFSVFPSKVYVAARRNMPKFDYYAFIKNCFPEYLEPQPQPFCGGGGGQHGYGHGYAQNYNIQQQQYQQYHQYHQRPFQQQAQQPQGYHHQQQYQQYQQQQQLRQRAPQSLMMLDQVPPPPTQIRIPTAQPQVLWDGDSNSSDWSPPPDIWSNGVMGGFRARNNTSSSGSMINDTLVNTVLEKKQTREVGVQADLCSCACACSGTRTKSSSPLEVGAERQQMKVQQEPKPTLQVSAPAPITQRFYEPFGTGDLLGALRF